MLHLRVLGSLSLASDAGDIPAAAQQKRRLGLLALLALAGDRGISRDRLQAYLWPESPNERSRHALDQLVYAVRRAVGVDPVAVEGRNLKLDPGVIDSDIRAFTRAMREERWADAVTAYHGPLVDGIDLSGSRDLESWIDAERSRVDQDYQRALESLAQSEAARGNTAGAISWWRKLSATEPLSPRLTLKLMDALAAEGEVASAVQQARIYQRAVKQELEIEPDPRVGELADRLSRTPTSHLNRSRAQPPAVEISHGAPEVETSGGASQNVEPEITRNRRSVTFAGMAAILLALVASLGILQRGSTGADLPSRARGVEPRARELHMRGLNAWNLRSQEGLDTAVIYFRRAIEVDPDYGDAYGGLANAYALLGYSGYRPANSMFSKARAAALRAIALDSTLAHPYAALGLALTWERKFNEAESAFKRSIALDPRYATAHQWYGMLLKILGRIDDAVAETGMAARLDPLSPQIQNTYGTFLAASGDEVAALRQYESMVEEEPDSAWIRQNPWLLTNIAAVYAASGMFEKALGAATRAVAIAPRHPRTLAALGSVYITMGQRDTARQIFARADTKNEHYPGQRGLFLLNLGERDSAFAAFAKVEEWPIPVLISLGGRSDLAADPRYLALQRRLGTAVHTKQIRARE